MGTMEFNLIEVLITLSVAIGAVFVFDAIRRRKRTS